MALMKHLWRKKSSSCQELDVLGLDFLLPAGEMGHSLCSRLGTGTGSWRCHPFCGEMPRGDRRSRPLL